MLTRPTKQTALARPPPGTTGETLPAPDGLLRLPRLEHAALAERHRHRGQPPDRLQLVHDHRGQARGTQPPFVPAKKWSHHLQHLR